MIPVEYALILQGQQHRNSLLGFNKRADLRNKLIIGLNLSVRSYDDILDDGLVVVGKPYVSGLRILLFLISIQRDKGHQLVLILVSFKLSFHDLILSLSDFHIVFKLGISHFFRI